MEDQGVLDNNIRHNECLAKVEAFVKAGGKIKQGTVLVRKLKKSTINKKSPERKLKLDGLNPVGKVITALKHHKVLTRKALLRVTGLGASTITACVKELEETGFLTRKASKSSIGREATYEMVEQ